MWNSQEAHDEETVYTLEDFVGYGNSNAGDAQYLYGE
jgi:hypothetical protein